MAQRPPSPTPQPNLMNPFYTPPTPAPHPQIDQFNAAHGLNTQKAPPQAPPGGLEQAIQFVQTLPAHVQAAIMAKIQEMQQHLQGRMYEGTGQRPEQAGLVPRTPMPGPGTPTMSPPPTGLGAAYARQYPPNQ